MIFLKLIYIALLDTELHAICHFFLMGCIGDKVKMDIKNTFINAISNYNYKTPIRSRFIMYSRLSHALNNVLLSIIKIMKINLENAAFLKIIF